MCGYSSDECGGVGYVALVRRNKAFVFMPFSVEAVGRCTVERSD